MNEQQPPARKPGPNTVAGEQSRSELGRWTADDNRRELTERQVAFAKAYAANGGKATEAARAAGYSTDHSRTIAPRLLSLPWVLRAVSIERKRLLERAGLLGLHVLIGVLEDQNEDNKLRVKAAEIALKADRADRDAEKESGAGKSLNQMTVGELEALIRRLDQAADQAKLPMLEGVSEQVPAATSTQAIDPAGESTVL